MKTGLVFLASFIMCASLATAQVARAIQDVPPALTTAQWEADLDSLMVRLPMTHGNLYHAVSEKDIHDAVRLFRAGLGKKNEDEILTGFVRLIGMIQDGHNYFDNTRGTDRHENYPVRLAWYPEGIYVERGSPEAANLVGGKLISIDGHPADSVCQIVLPLIPHDPQNLGNARTRISQYMTEAHLLHGLGVTSTAQQARFVVEKEGKRVERMLHPMVFSRSALRSLPPTGWVDARGKGDHFALSRQHPDSTFWLTYLSQYQTLFVQINRIEDDPKTTMAQFSRRMTEAARSNMAKRLILDLRWNGGGNNYLLKPLIVGLIQLGEINMPGHLIVLTGPRTFSAAQNFVNRLENITEAIFVGEPTGENVNFYGDTRNFELPNSHCRVVLSNLWWQDKDPRDKRWATFPEIAVSESFEDFVQNRDPVLEYVLHHNEIPTIEEIVLSGLKEGGYNGALAATASYKSDPVRRYIDVEILEGKINNLGYLLLAEKKTDDAIQVFKVNTVVFPVSFNTWDSLGEAYADAGQKAEAIAAYKKSLELNPTSKTGLDALSRLQK
jgi:tetratricopeptide (TPR) repeat protein